MKGSEKSMLDCVDHGGYIVISRKEENGDKQQTIHYAYDFKQGKLSLHLFENVPEVNGENLVIGTSFDNKKYLFGTQIPISLFEYGMFPSNYNQEVDFVIKGYEPQSAYTEAIFDFDELQYFCPSPAVVKSDDKNNVIFSRERIDVKEFQIDINLIKCNVKFIVAAKGKWGFAHSNMEAVTEIHVVFPETRDIDFLRKIYLTVDCVFAFICNRRNTTCRSMRLIGKYPSKTISDGKIVDCEKICNSEMFFYDKYREEPEEQKIVAKTWDASPIFKHIDALFNMVAEDISGNLDEGGNISISSIHPSIKRRNLIDLQQSMQITSAFEFYARRYYKDMISEKDYHTVMKMILNEVKNKSKGKMKELAKNMSDNVVREPALKDKVWKIYKGYDSYAPIKNCISEDWFKSDDIQILAQEANDWRNELAHSKRSHEPTINTIMAVRMIEHFNYAIILRQLGFEDDEILNLLRSILKR